MKLSVAPGQCEAVIVAKKDPTLGFSFGYSSKLLIREHQPRAE